jgi:hypothetical protein
VIPKIIGANDHFERSAKETFPGAAGLLSEDVSVVENQIADESRLRGIAPGARSAFSAYLFNVLIGSLSRK